MSEKLSQKFIEQPSQKSFGVVFSIVFLIIGLFPLADSKDVHLWALIISVIFLIFAFFAPQFLDIPNKLWFKFGIFLGSIIAPVVMALVYLVTVVPTGIIMRLFGKDLLKLKLDKNAKSYWIMRNEPTGSMKNQF